MSYKEVRTRLRESINNADHLEAELKNRDLQLTTEARVLAEQSGKAINLGMSQLASAGVEIGLNKIVDSLECGIKASEANTTGKKLRNRLNEIEWGGV